MSVSEDKEGIRRGDEAGENTAQNEHKLLAGSLGVCFLAVFGGVWVGSEVETSFSFQLFTE